MFASRFGDAVNGRSLPQVRRFGSSCECCAVSHHADLAVGEAATVLSAPCYGVAA